MNLIKVQVSPLKETSSDKLLWHLKEQSYRNALLNQCSICSAHCFGDYCVGCIIKELKLRGGDFKSLNHYLRLQQKKLQLHQEIMKLQLKIEGDLHV